MAKLKMGVAVAMTALRAVSATKTRPRSLPALDDFCTALSRATGLDIESSLEDDYPSLLSAMRSGQVAFAWLPPVVALRAVNVGRARTRP
jgi:ABC-type phosphate/phosphonate transport system substrate-binding protein